MPRQLRVQFPGAVYHLMSRGDRRESIFPEDADRHDFLCTLSEACRKTGWEVFAYCLMSNHFHLVVQTPHANLVEGMRWLLSSYTIRLNHRHRLFGHVFSGRYKAILVDPFSKGYLKTVCDYVHLNPIRANLLDADEPLAAYPWSSILWYQSSPKHRPEWIAVGPLFGEYGLKEDSARTRKDFAARMEKRRRQEQDEEEFAQLRRGWCFGEPAFKALMLELIEDQVRENHSGELHLQTARTRAERIIREEFKRLGWTKKDLAARRKNDPDKLAIATRLRKETTLTIKAIAEMAHLGTSKSANTKLHNWMAENRKETRKKGRNE